MLPPAIAQGPSSEKTTGAPLVVVALSARVWPVVITMGDPWLTAPIPPIEVAMESCGSAGSTFTDWALLPLVLRTLEE